MTSLDKSTFGRDAQAPGKRFALLVVMVLAAAACRLLPHPNNFTPVGAMALFSGAAFVGWGAALLVPVATMFVSDWFLGFDYATPAVYVCLLVSVLLGRWAGTRRPAAIAAATLAGAAQFFLITNFVCWLAAYPHTWHGLAECYAAALPFLRNSLAGDVTFAALMFGTLALAERRLPVLRRAPAAA